MAERLGRAYVFPLNVEMVLDLLCLLFFGLFLRFFLGDTDIQEDTPQISRRYFLQDGVRRYPKKPFSPQTQIVLRHIRRVLL